MDNDERRLLADCFTEIRDANQMANEAIDRFLSELGKPIIEKTPGQATLAHPPKKSSSLSFYDDSKITFRDVTSRKGNPALRAYKEDNEGNPEFGTLIKVIESTEKNGRWPYFILDNGDIWKNIKK